MKTIEVRRINMVETSKDDYKLANDELMRSNYYIKLEECDLANLQGEIRCQE